MIELLQYEFMQRAFFGAILIGLCTGLLGPYLVLRRLSLVGDGLAHVAFGGIALGFLLKTPPFLTALVVAIFGSLLIRYLIKKNVYGEAAIALILSFGIGLGVIIIGATKGFGVDLFSYLIGSILALRWFDISLLGVLALFIIGFLFYFRRELFLLTFHKEMAEMLSSKTNLADYIFTLLISFVVIMSIQAVGILLVSALLVIPSLIALKLSSSFSRTILLSTILSVCAAIIGVAGSFYADVPPSGFIVIFLLVGYIVVAGLQKSGLRLKI